MTEPHLVWSGPRESRSEFPSQGLLCVPDVSRRLDQSPCVEPEHCVNQDAPNRTKYASSTTPQPRQTDNPPSPDDELPESSGAFKDILQRDPTVCNNCFSITHDAVAYDRWSGVHGWTTLEWWDARPDATIPAHHERMTYGMTSACTCGEITAGKRRPLSYSETLEYGENILGVLDEKDIDVDAFEFRRVLRERKSDPDLQGREDLGVFAPAVDAGIRAANQGELPSHDF